MREGSDNVDASPTRVETSLFSPATIQVALLGVNVWAVVLLIPWLTSHPVFDQARIIALVGTLAPLFVGSFLVAPGSRAATFALLFVYPIALGFGIAALPRWTEETPHSAPGMVVAAVSFLAFLASASSAARESAPRIAAKLQAVSAPAPSDPPGRVRLQRALFFVLGTGCFGLATIGPFLPPTSRADEASQAPWAEVATFVAVASIMLGVAVLGSIYAPALRRSRRHVPPRRTRLRVLALVWAAVLGLLIYGSLELGGPPSTLLP